MGKSFDRERCEVIDEKLTKENHAEEHKKVGERISQLSSCTHNTEEEKHRKEYEKTPRIEEIPGNRDWHITIRDEQKRGNALGIPKFQAVEHFKNHPGESNNRDSAEKNSKCRECSFQRFALSQECNPQEECQRREEEEQRLTLHEDHRRSGYREKE